MIKNIGNAIFIKYTRKSPETLDGDGALQLSEISMKQKPIPSQTSQRLHQHPSATDYQVSTLDFIKAHLKDALKLLPIVAVVFLICIVQIFVVYSIFGG